MSGFRDFLYGHVLSYDRHLGQTYCRACEARGDGLDRRCPKAVDGEAAQARQDRETSRGPVEAARQSSDRGEPGTVNAPAIPDSSDRDLQLSKSPRIQGWTVNEWTRFVETHPDCTLPGGVGGAIVAELERQLAEAHAVLADRNEASHKAADAYIRLERQLVNSLEIASKYEDRYFAVKAELDALAAPGTITVDLLAGPNAPVSDNASGMYCRACRATGMTHCAHPEECGGMEPMG